MRVGRRFAMALRRRSGRVDQSGCVMAMGEKGAEMDACGIHLFH